jgi:hypothetical protein
MLPNRLKLAAGEEVKGNAPRTRAHTHMRQMGKKLGSIPFTSSPAFDFNGLGGAPGFTDPSH